MDLRCQISLTHTHTQKVNAAVCTLPQSGARQLQVLTLQLDNEDLRNEPLCVSHYSETSFSLFCVFSTVNIIQVVISNVSVIQ